MENWSKISSKFWGKFAEILGRIIYEQLKFQEPV